MTMNLKAGSRRVSLMVCRSVRGFCGNEFAFKSEIFSGSAATGDSLVKMADRNDDESATEIARRVCLWFL